MQSALWGMARVVHAEHPKFRCARIDLDPQGDASQWQSLLGEIWAPDKELEVAFRSGTRDVPRLVPQKSSESRGLQLPDGPYQLKLSKYGVLDNLVVQPLPRREPGPGKWKSPCTPRG